MSKKQAEQAGRMWVRAIKGHRALKDVIVPCQRAEPIPALREALRTIDLGMPIWMPRHQADWDSFALTRFLPEHFMESVDFERLEVSYIAPDETRKPKPPAQL